MCELLTLTQHACQPVWDIVLDLFSFPARRNSPCRRQFPVPRHIFLAVSGLEPNEDTRTNDVCRGFMKAWWTQPGSASVAVFNLINNLQVFSTVSVKSWILWATERDVFSWASLWVHCALGKYQPGAPNLLLSSPTLLPLFRFRDLTPLLGVPPDFTYLHCLLWFSVTPLWPAN